MNAGGAWTRPPAFLSSSERIEMTAALSPPRGAGPLARREARLAWALLLPTLLAVALVVILPLLAVFWISVKPVTLADLRPPTPVVREDLRGRPKEAGDTATIRYRLRNSIQERTIRDVTLADRLPEGLTASDLDPRCTLEGRALFCDLGDWEGGFRDRVRIPVTVDRAFLDAGADVRDTPVRMTGSARNVLTDFSFTAGNFARVFDGSEFWTVLGVTIFYTVFGTVGALVMGLFAALLLDKAFRGQGILRGLYLFPYVAPVIAVAFTWVLLLDPFSGSVNALLIQMGVTDTAINFFGQKPLAVIMVTAFEVWRYFPLSFLFILARMQAIDHDMYEAAEMDGASPFQRFLYLSLPMLLGILSVFFLLRFIWTFNKFGDIFLLTGGNAGTRTLTVNVYEQAFAISNIGAGAAVAVVIFACLLLFIFLLLPLHQSGGRAVRALRRGSIIAPILGALWAFVVSTSVAVAISFATGEAIRPTLLWSLIFGAVAGWVVIRVHSPRVSIAAALVALMQIARRGSVGPHRECVEKGGRRERHRTGGFRQSSAPGPSVLVDARDHRIACVAPTLYLMHRPFPPSPGSSAAAPRSNIRAAGFAARSRPEAGPRLVSGNCCSCAIRRPGFSADRIDRIDRIKRWAGRPDHAPIPRPPHRRTPSPSHETRSPDR